MFENEAACVEVVAVAAWDIVQVVLEPAVM